MKTIKTIKVIKAGRERQVFKMTEVWLSSGKAAAMLGVTTTTLRNWERKGILVPDRKLGRGHRRYSAVQMNEFIRSLRGKTD